MKATSDVVRRQFTVKESQPTAVTASPPLAEEKKLASEIKTDRNINFNDIEKVKIVDSTENSGFYCKDCNLSFKDSVSFIDHLNSRTHQRNLGIEMRVEKSSLDQVAARIEYHKKRLFKSEESVDDLLAKKIKDAQDARISKRNMKKQRIKSEKLQKLQSLSDHNSDNDDMMQQMGFSNFK